MRKIFLSTLFWGILCLQIVVGQNSNQHSGSKKEDFLESNINNFFMPSIIKDQEGGNHKNAMDILNDLLKNKNLKLKYPESYSKLKERQIVSLFALKRDKEAINTFNEILPLKENIKDFEGLCFLNGEMSNYYLTQNRKSKAKSHAISACDNALKTGDKELQFEKIEFLLVNFQESALSEYFNKHAQLKEDLIREINEVEKSLDRANHLNFEKERSNKKLIEEKKLLNLEIEKQKQQKMVAGLVAMIALFTLCFVLLLFTKKKRKIFQSNELEKERVKYQERDKIAQKLRGPVLTNLHGIRRNAELFNLGIEKGDSQKYKSFLNDLESLENELDKVSDDLTTSNKQDFNISIHQLFYKKSKEGNFTYDLELGNKKWTDLEDKYLNIIYTTLQELLQNTLKHAKATKVKLSIKRSKNDVFLKYKDNGIGFNINNQINGIGLKNIKSKVEKLNGESSIFSKPEKGMQIEIKLPLRH
ncbi:sensor histidine kinase [Tenacibaculum xiamenense]|uniref:sensor histidine kinase n=1 Tax=Tenacibaculum xiamenense TaxID=1261553 RepID=UPI0038946EB5